MAHENDARGWWQAVSHRRPSKYDQAAKRVREGRGTPEDVKRVLQGYDPQRAWEEFLDQCFWQTDTSLRVANLAAPKSDETASPSTT